MIVVSKEKEIDKKQTDLQILRLRFHLTFLMADNGTKNEATW